MTFDDFKTKDAVVIVYTGENKGKTSAALGLLVRALGNRWKVAYIQFITYGGVGEHVFINDIQPVYTDSLYFYKGGKAFSEPDGTTTQQVTDEQHKQAAQTTYDEALTAVSSGDYDLVICDEINRAAHDGLVSQEQLATLLQSRAPSTSLCLTGHNFPEKLLDQVDIATEMVKLRHHADDNFAANKGIDF